MPRTTESTYNSTGCRAAPLAVRSPDAAVVDWATRQLERERSESELAALGAPSHDLRFPALIESGTPLPTEGEALERLLASRARNELEKKPAHEYRCHVRQSTAQYLERVVLPARADPKLQNMVQRLASARLGGSMLYRAIDQRWMWMYDSKAECPLLCPDDAREEGDRLRRRYLPHLLDWASQPRRSVHSIVFTWPHAAAGGLAARMRSLLLDVAQLLKSTPDVVGSLLVEESPLSAARNWNVHVNAIVMVDAPVLDYQELRRRWHWQLEARKVEGDEDELHAALRELLKYPVQAMPSKSLEHSASTTESQNVTPAPALTQWTAAEFLEWWDAHQRFRRTRSYGRLHGISKPPPESVEGFVVVGWFHMWQGRLYARTLLDSIQGYNSQPVIPTLDPRKVLAQVRGPPE